MSILRRALEREEWEVAALCLVLGTLEAAAKLPREAVGGLAKTLSAPRLSGGRSGRGRRS